MFSIAHNYITSYYLLFFSWRSKTNYFSNFALYAFNIAFFDSRSFISLYFHSHMKYLDLKMLVSMCLILHSYNLSHSTIIWQQRNPWILRVFVIIIWYYTFFIIFMKELNHRTFWQWTESYNYLFIPNYVKWHVLITLNKNDIL